MLKSRALWVWGRNGPVSAERTTRCEKGDLCSDPSTSYYDRYDLDHSLVTETARETVIEYQNACFERIDDIEHTLRLLGIVASNVFEDALTGEGGMIPKDTGILRGGNGQPTDLFRHEHNLGTVDSLSDIFWRKILICAGRV